jgi:hypothetical protein
LKKAASEALISELNKSVNDDSYQAFLLSIEDQVTVEEIKP